MVFAVVSTGGECARYNCQTDEEGWCYHGSLTCGFESAWTDTTACVLNNCADPLCGSPGGIARSPAPMFEFGGDCQYWDNVKCWSLFKITGVDGNCLTVQPLVCPTWTNPCCDG